ncbi:MAG: MFS transporter [Acidimicrobiales bacterium]
MRTDRWLGALAERDFRLYFIGRTTSFIGTGMLPVALSFAVLARGAPIADVGYVLGAETLPLVLFLLVAGVVADRYNRRAVMVVADLVRAAAQAVLAGWILVGRPPIWGFLVCELLVGTGWAFFQPAMTGLIPEVTRPEHLQQANALNGVAQWGGTLVGPAIAGIVVSTAGPGWAVAADASSYLVSVACLARLRVGWERRPGDEPFLVQLRGGWQAFKERTWLWAIVAQFSTLGLFVFPAFFVLGAVVAKRSLGGAVVWGAVLAAFGAGSVIGGVAMLRVQPRRPLRVAELALLGWSVLFAALALHAPAAVVGLAGAVAGLSFGIFGPLWDTTMQREIPPELLARASAYDWFGSFVFLPVGYAIEGFMAQWLGVTGALWLAAGWLALTTVTVLALPSVTGMVAAGIETPEVVHLQA